VVQRFFLLKPAKLLGTHLAPSMYLGRTIWPWPRYSTRGGARDDLPMRGEIMSWGLCRECKWWQIEPDASIANPTVGLCIEEVLQPYRLRITGNGGCNKFIEGTPARAAGSSGTPPTAQPQR
jgi:hypothetical protein